MKRVFTLVPDNAAVKPGGATVVARESILSSLPPLSVYIHVPWCVRKCPYCDFNSHVWKGQGDLPEGQFLAALRADLEQALPLIWGRQIYSVFIGGGTPSLLSAEAIDEILAMLRACLNLWPGAEITLEANPGTAEAGRFRDYAASGINRLSLGVQSFNDTALKALGRIHDARQARAAIEMAQAAVERVNLDIMFALPEQTLQGALDDLEQALSWQTGHLSLYNLTLEPNTLFAKYPPTVPDDDLAALMQDELAARATEAGFERYEVSAYARPGQRSLHNVNYWEFGDYLGIGPGAHGKLSFHDKIVRQVRLRNPVAWMDAAVKRNGSHIAQNAPVKADELPFEFMLNALRLKEGVSSASFSERTGLPFVKILPVLNRLTEQGLIESNPMRIKTTETGWRFLSDVQAAFL